MQINSTGSYDVTVDGEPWLFNGFEAFHYNKQWYPPCLPPPFFSLPPPPASSLQLCIAKVFKWNGSPTSIDRCQYGHQLRLGLVARISIMMQDEEVRGEGRRGEERDERERNKKKKEDTKGEREGGEL